MRLFIGSAKHIRRIFETEPTRFGGKFEDVIHIDVGDCYGQEIVDAVASAITIHGLDADYRMVSQEAVDVFRVFVMLGAIPAELVSAYYVWYRDVTDLEITHRGQFNYVHGMFKLFDTSLKLLIRRSDMGMVNPGDLETCKRYLS